MKKNNVRVVFLISLILVSLFGFSSFTKSPTTIKGTIVSYGNEPFTYPGIKTTKGKNYLVVSSDETKTELLKQQGKLIKFTGYIMKDKEKFPIGALEDGAFKIVTWEVIPLK